MILFIHAKIVYNSTSYSAAPSGSILNLSNSGKTENSASVGPSHSHQLNLLAFAGVRLRSVAFGCVLVRLVAFGCVRLLVTPVLINLLESKSPNILSQNLIIGFFYSNFYSSIYICLSTVLHVIFIPHVHFSLLKVIL